MDLKEFTTQTLVQIVEGATEANTQLSNKGAFIPSENYSTDRGYAMAYDKNRKPHFVVDVEFDVAVMATESGEKSGGVGISVMSVNLGGSIGSKVENQTVSRVKYTLPLALSGK